MVSSALLVARGGARSLDLAEVGTAGGQTKVWSFLALLYGLPADIDLESEACRCFGAARFDIYAALRMLSLRSYTAQLRHRMGPEVRPMRPSQNRTHTHAHASALAPKHTHTCRLHMQYAAPSIAAEPCNPGGRVGTGSVDDG